ncbi:unnamed protein product [Ilex paraguariensis]|uniref:Fibronectin type-III domain-containing protein n=1 Tax=Ilex paraguariensis TaxID=185542 RepID=A0ABC8TJ02_9AQUA
MASNIIRFEHASASSLTLILGSEDPSPESVMGYTLWHRKADDMNYPEEPTCTLLAPNTGFLLSGLTPATNYLFKVVCFDGQGELGTCEVQYRTGSSGDEALHPNPKRLVERSQSPTTNCSSLSNPSSLEEKLTLASPTVMRMKKPYSNGQTIEATSADNGPNTPVKTCMECVPFAGSSEAGLPITPCKLENIKDGLVRNSRPNLSNKDLDDGCGKEEEPQAGSKSKKRSGERRDEVCAGIGDKDFEYYVKVIRWLECEGHIETTFRQKFLTWYSLRATSQEVRVVKVFVDTLNEDPASLAAQLVDTFSEVISSKRSPAVPAGFCLKLWH